MIMSCQGHAWSQSAQKNLRNLLHHDVARKLLHSIPKLGKLLAILFLFVNIRSWPLVWHLRAFREVIKYRVKYKLIRTRMLFMSLRSGLKLEDNWHKSQCPVGANPFDMVIRYHSWASIDDCDFNFHLSNSSYGKVLDYARMKAAMKMFTVFFRAGGWLPLAATHYHFIREIPMFQSYEIRASIAAWDQKWAYLVIKFVCKDGKKPGSGISAPGIGGTPISSRDTPLSFPNGNAAAGTEASLTAVAEQLAGHEMDGATLHTLHVSQICFKIGRITVPPGIVLAANGFTGKTGPHAEWQDAWKVISKPLGGSPKKMKELMTGGWKNVPENERWWDAALGGEVEERRVRNLRLVERLSEGLRLLR